MRVVDINIIFDSPYVDNITVTEVDIVNIPAFIIEYGDAANKLNQKIDSFEVFNIREDK